MKINQLSEVIWRYYQDGRAKATNQTLRRADIEQMVKMNFGNMLRDAYYASKKQDPAFEPDVDFFSYVLSVQEFPLSDANIQGLRKADMNAFDLYRMPKNAHIVNVIPIGTGCKGWDGSWDVTQVSPGEENFYLGPEFTSFGFYRPQGRTLLTWHFPPCITSVQVESTFATDDVDVGLDMAYEISTNILDISLKIKQFPVKILDNSYDPNAVELRRRLQEQQP